MYSQNEVIVCAKPSVYFPPNKISIEFSDEELDRYQASLVEGADDFRAVTEDYGYWIDPAGISHTVRWEEHSSVIYQLAQSDIADAISKGWVRVVCPSPDTPYPSWSIETSSAITSEAMKRLNATLSEHECPVYLDLWPDELSFKTNNTAQARAITRAYAQGRLLSDTDLLRFKI